MPQHFAAPPSAAESPVDSCDAAAPEPIDTRSEDVGNTSPTRNDGSVPQQEGTRSQLGRRQTWYRPHSAAVRRA